MGYDSHLPLKKSGQSVIDRNLPYRFLRGQPLKSRNDLQSSTAALIEPRRRPRYKATSKRP